MGAAAAAASTAASQSFSFDQTQYKEKSRKLVDLVNQLRDAGAQATFTVPTLVVCGNQSAGKSSLLERLCAVKLPRAAGTCTKCPTEVRLSTAPPGGSDTWCCQIKLRKEYGKDNRALEPKPKEVVFKSLNQDLKDQLHFYVSAAQRALLNPDTPADIFVKDADRAASESLTKRASNSSFDDLADSAAGAVDVLKFTRNVVVLEITGADVDLALIDLPGIIQTEQGDDGSNVELVKQLVQQYISSDRAIIVATITCKDDIDNQAIVQMARAADKDGMRTIGVLTKADTIEPGTHNNWFKILKGENYQLRLGYYCVVNPSQEDINNNISQEEAAAKELDFFERDTFFGSDAVASVKQRFGVDALRVQLSKQLVSLTQRELPKMKVALEEVLAQTEAQLRKLPPPPASDPSFELFSRLRDLAKAVAQAVEGSDNAQFVRTADQYYTQFRQCVLTARPTVRLTSGSAAPVNSCGRAWQEEDPEFWLGGPAHDEDAAETEPEGLITLEKARKLAQQYRVRELPSFPPYRVLEELVRGLKGRWDAAAVECVHAVGEALQELTDQLVEEHFGQFAGARKEIRAMLYKVHAALMAHAEQRIRALMAMERDQIWTQNDHYMVSSKQCFEDLLTKQLYGSGKASQADAVNKCSNNYTAKQNIHNALAALALAGITLSAQDLDMAVARKKQKTAEQDGGLLELIAGTLAYFKVSSKRVIDGVPMHLHYYLLQRFCKQLNDLPAKLASGFTGVDATAGSTDESSSLPGREGYLGGADSSNEEGDVGSAEDGAGKKTVGEGQAVVLDAAKLMAEDESTAERRAQLHRQLKQLQGVRMILSVF